MVENRGRGTREGIIICKKAKEAKNREYTSTHIPEFKLTGCNEQNQQSNPHPPKGRSRQHSQVQTETLNPIALAPAPTPPSHPKNLSLLNFSPLGALPNVPYPSSKSNPSTSKEPVSPFQLLSNPLVLAQTDMNRIRLSFLFRKNQCEDHRRAPRRRFGAVCG